MSGLPVLLVILIPLVFIGFWLLITAILGKVSGWYLLQSVYPDRPETALKPLRFQSATMGRGMPVNYNNCLRFDVCASGLRVDVLRILGPFQQPYFVPWSDITATEKRILFGRAVRLRFRKWPGGVLTIRKGAFDRIAESTPLG